MWELLSCPLIKNVADSQSSTYLKLLVTCISCQEPFCLLPGSYFDASLDFVSLCLTLRGAQKSLCLTLQAVQKSLCLAKLAALNSLHWMFVRCRRQLGGQEVFQQVPGSGAQGSLVLKPVILAEVLLGQLLLPSRYSE